MKAKAILEDNQTAIVIFTDGLSLEINNDNSGRSGVWKIKENLSVDKIIIYRRDKSMIKNEIFIGDFIGLSPSKIEGLENRFVVEFSNLEFLGETDQNWNGFTETARGASLPIRYIKKD